MFDRHLRYRARAQPDAVAVATGSGLIHYARFDADIDRVALRLAGLGLLHGTRIGVRLANPYVHWLMVLALARLDLVSVALPDESDRVGTLVPDLILTDRPDDTTPLHRPITGAWLREALATPAPAGTTQGMGLGHGIARIMPTAGGDGARRAVCYTNDWIERGLSRFLLACATRPGGLLCTLPTSKAVGFLGPLAAWAQGGTVLFGPPRQILPQLRPDLLLTAADDLDGLLSEWPDRAAPDPGLLTIIAGPVDAITVMRCAELISPNIQRTYATAECGVIAIGPAQAASPRAVGTVLPAFDLQVVDPRGHPVPPGMPGEFRLRDWQGLARAQSDVAGAGSLHDGWFYPGDLGSIDAAGGVCLDRPIGEIAALRGLRVPLIAAENTARAVPGVADAAAFVLPPGAGEDHLWLAVVRDDAFDAAALRDALAPFLELTLKLQVVWAEHIPRDERGQPRRDILRAAAQAGLQSRQF